MVNPDLETLLLTMPGHTVQVQWDHPTRTGLKPWGHDFVVFYWHPGTSGNGPSPRTSLGVLWFFTLAAVTRETIYVSGPYATQHFQRYLQEHGLSIVRLFRKQVLSQRRCVIPASKILRNLSRFRSSQQVPLYHKTQLLYFALFDFTILGFSPDTLNFNKLYILKGRIPIASPTYRERKLRVSSKYFDGHTVSNFLQETRIG